MLSLIALLTLREAWPSGQAVPIRTRNAPLHRHRPESQAVTVRRFTQRFYDWYATKVFQSDQAWAKNPHPKEGPIEVDVLAVTTKSNLFSPEIRRALLEDRRAQEKEPEYIVGIEFDPFLNGQDPARWYYARQVQHRGKAWLVSVWSDYGKQSHKPDVIAQVERGNRGWTFTNFIYPEPPKTDLLTELRRLKAVRERPVKKP